MLSHFLLPKEHTVHLSTARLPLPPLRHLGPSPRRCWCPRFCRRRNRRTRVWFRSERLRQAAARCVHSRALSPSALPAARCPRGPAVWQFLQCALTNFLLRTAPPPPLCLPVTQAGWGQCAILGWSPGLALWQSGTLGRLRVLTQPDFWQEAKAGLWLKRN